MELKNQIISGQLRIGDDDTLSFPLARIMEKITAAHDLAGLTRLLFFPSLDPKLNLGIVEHCRKLGVEVFLWYKVLAGNDILHERSEMTEDAWGDRAFGESGVWPRVAEKREYYSFGCPRNAKYNNLLINRCQHMLKSYEGLFVDSIGFPSPSLGLESVFSCFCPQCLEIEPRLLEWRRRVQDLRECVVSASDADLERWGTFRGVIGEFELVEFFDFRRRSLDLLARRYAEIAKKQGKEIGIDVSCPALSDPCGHDYSALGAFADWLKPRIYCRTYGPSSIPLEFHCLAMGIQAWGRRYSTPAVMAFIERSIDIKMPPNIHNLSQTYATLETVHHEIAKAQQLTQAPIHPGIECSIHPDFATGLDDSTVRGYIEATRKCPGLVLSWNILFIPDAFFRLVGRA